SPLTVAPLQGLVEVRGPRSQGVALGCFVRPFQGKSQASVGCPARLLGQCRGPGEAIRKADPSYDPKKDHDLRADDCPDCPRMPNSESNCSVQWTLWSVILLGLRFLIPDIFYAVRWI